MIRLKKIRDSAKMQDCTMNSVCCNYSPETVIFAHYGEPGEKGTGLKPDDTSGAYLCSGCHDWADRRTSNGEYLAGDAQYYWFRAMRRTWKLLVENGVLK